MWILFSPFVPSVHHFFFIVCCVLIKPVLFKYFCFCFLQNMQNSAPFLCAFFFPHLFAPLPNQILIPGIWVRWLCQITSELSQLPQHGRGFFHCWPHFNPCALSPTEDSPPCTLTLPLWSFLALSFAFFPESYVVHVDYAGLNLQRSMLGLKMCTKMPGLPALGSKNCFLPSPGTQSLYSFGFSYWHL